MITKFIEFYQNLQDEARVSIVNAFKLGMVTAVIVELIMIPSYIIAAVLSAMTFGALETPILLFLAVVTIVTFFARVAK